MSSPSHAAQSTSKGSAKDAANPQKKLLKNEQIPYASVRVIDPETRALSEPTSLHYLISQLDKKKFYYTLVTDNPTPLVRLVSKEEAYQQKLEAKRQKKERMQNTAELKEIQMTWGVEKGDLKHKLDKVLKELKNKNVVNVILAKKNSSPPSAADKEKLLQEILDILKDEAKERRARTVSPAFAILYLAPLGSASPGGNGE